VLSQPLNQISFVALDFETTGLSAAKDRVLEVAAVRFGLPGPGIQAQFSSLLNPACLIPEDVIAIHGIDQAAVAGAPDFAQIAPELLDFLAGAVLVAHHAPFDAAFLLRELRRSGLEPPPFLLLDTFQLAKKSLPNAPGYKLTSLLTHLGLSLSGPAHRALPDSLGCASLLQALLQREPNWQRLSLADLLDSWPEILLKTQPDPTDCPHQHMLQAAIQQQQDLLLAYHNTRQQQLERQITPLLLGGTGPRRYVEAFCHLRQANRQFRLNRIQDLSPIAVAV